MSEATTDVLANHNLRKTDIRLKVLRMFQTKPGEAFTQTEIDASLEGADRITLYRTLKTFEEKGIIHQAVDGSGVNKYALCNHKCTDHEHFDNHAHFLCTKCGSTLCLEEDAIPKIKAPKGYKIEESHLVLKGQCKECSPKYGK